MSSDTKAKIISTLYLGLTCLHFYIIGCTDIQPPPPLPETGCDVAADYLEDLECDELMIIPGPDEIPGTTDDWSWLEYCETVQESGIVVLNTDCLMDAGDCDAAAVCLD